MLFVQMYFSIEVLKYHFFNNFSYIFGILGEFLAKIPKNSRKFVRLNSLIRKIQMAVAWLYPAKNLKVLKYRVIPIFNFFGVL